MDSSRDNSVGGGNGGSGGFEESLRVIARLPAPEGLEERVIAGVRAKSRGARILHFPEVLRPGSSWMRGAAAAAIVFVVAGGGWEIYSRVQKPQAAKVITIPVRMAAPGGFSNAGAMRTPNTLTGPVVPVPVTPKQEQAGVVVLNAKKANRKAAVTEANKAAVQPMAAK